jgi:hypothetical protein
MPDQNKSLNKKTEQKNVQNSLSQARNTIFSAILNFAAILKTCEKNFLNFSKFEALILIETVAKNESMDFLSFFKLIFLLFFGKMASEKNQDGVQFEVSLQKLLESQFFQCFRLFWLKN